MGGGTNWWFTGSDRDKDLLGGLRKRHASKGRRQGFRIHFASGTLEIIILPRLHVRRLKENVKDTSTKIIIINKPKMIEGKIEFCLSVVFPFSIRFHLWRFIRFFLRDGFVQRKLFRAGKLIVLYYPRNNLEEKVSTCLSESREPNLEFIVSSIISSKKKFHIRTLGWHLSSICRSQFLKSCIVRSARITGSTITLLIKRKPFLN